MFEFLRRIPKMLGLKAKGRRAAPKGSAADASVDGGSSADESGGRSGPRRPKSPSQRRSGPKPKSSGGGRPKRKK